MISATPPRYPEMSRRLHEQGTVYLSVLVGTDGAVSEISVSRSSGSARLDKAALDQRCLDAIARHKRPKEYRPIDALPRNAAGKVLKKELRTLAEAGDE